MATVDRFEARLDDPMAALCGRAWAEIEADHARLREEAEAGVTEWAWGPYMADWERYEPFWAQQDGQRPKTRRIPEPEDPQDGRKYGFGEDGAVLVAREIGDSFGPDVVPREALRVELGGREAQVVFESPRWNGGKRQLAQLHVPTYDADGRLVRLDIWFYRDENDGFTWWGKRYEYEGDRVVVIREASRQASSRIFQPGAEGLPEGFVARSQVEMRLAYDEHGELLTIRRGPEADDRVVYRRTARGAAAKARRLLEVELPQRILDWAARCAPGEPVCCLAIHYAEHYNRPLPPSLALGTVAGEWNPAEFPIHDVTPPELDDDALEAAYQALNQEWASTDDDRQPRQLLVRVAKAVAALPRPPSLQAGAAFAVYAVDLELADLERNLRASVPRAVVKALGRGGG